MGRWALVVSIGDTGGTGHPRRAVGKSDCEPGGWRFGQQGLFGADGGSCSLSACQCRHAIRPTILRRATPDLLGESPAPSGRRNSPQPHRSSKRNQKVSHLDRQQCETLGTPGGLGHQTRIGEAGHPDARRRAKNVGRAAQTGRSADPPPRHNGTTSGDDHRADGRRLEQAPPACLPAASRRWKKKLSTPSCPQTVMPKTSARSSRSWS